MDTDGDRVVAADVPALDVDLDQWRVAADVPVVEMRRELTESRAGRHDEIRFTDERGRFRRSRSPQWAHVERMRARDGVVAPVRGDHRHRAALAQPPGQVVRAGPGDAATDQQQRPLGLPEQTRGLADGVRMWRWRVRRSILRRLEPAIGVERLAQHIAGNLDEDRT